MVAAMMTMMITATTEAVFSKETMTISRSPS
jgi:hypothetical protein